MATTNLDFTEFINIIRKDNFRGTNFIEYKDGGGEIYISFKTLLKFLDTYTNLESRGKPILKIDWESDKPFLAYSTTVSCNLQKCYVFNSYLDTTDGNFSKGSVLSPFEEFRAFQQGSKITALNTTLRQEAGDPTKYSIYPVIGNINNIYLNAGYLSTQLTEGSDNSESKVTIRAFLQTICDGVNKALGGTNDFQVVVDADENQATIVDFNQKRIKGLSAINGNNITTIKAQGLGSFLTNISAQSSITPDMATMISIGAQAGGNALGEEATSFSRLSRGITDRVYPEKIITNSKNKTPDGKDPGDFENTINAYKQIIQNQKSQGETQQAIFFKSDANTNLENIAVDLYKGCLGTFTKVNQTSTTFIPVKLDFTLAGISGIKIFQRFTISGDVLPYTYKDNFDFIVTGVSHDISNDSIWHTKIASIIALKEEPVKPLTGTFIDIGDISADSIEANATPSRTRDTSYPNLPYTEPPPPSNSLTYINAKKYLVSKYGESLAKAVFAIMIAEAAKNTKRTAFVSAGGHNYAGVQTDSGQWGVSGITGQYKRVDSGGATRSFAIFDSDDTFLDFMANRVKAKKFTGTNGDEWTTTYINSWWSPVNKANYTKGTSTYNEKLAIYNTAIRIYNKS